MRKMIWTSSVCAFIPVLAGLAILPFGIGVGWWSLAAGCAFAALAFGAFLELAQNVTSWKGLKGFLPVAIPAAALISIGAMGAFCLDMLNRHLLRPETFVAGILAGTLFSQVALIRSSFRLSSLRD
ncbi:MAG: hypothetical protein A3G34_07650 [Candidatus Lindowbacteria bacterium RIFCSPLOWO2_12_FULL_62_27]|nr:MAG: hypothetical protein A3G34_07650 [Candidatus Lindowbacteria bacterium RIFCSPLOWO2_12_FULL_62_27]OGH63557.1 MAG: hypothetical protein A3I06_06890 [Candidatus Lindowbacteria bacterium RIFCSPLOWO2_02_FULL_62_12]